jgi:Protein of unknown function (DUF1573)
MIFSLNLLVKLNLKNKMKKIVLFAMVLAFGLTANAQTKTKVKTKPKTTKVTATKVTPTVAQAPKAVAASATDGPGILFESETIDYGTIAHNADGKREFVFTNNGNKPLIITAANGSCGCTVPTYPKDPIAPGEKAVIGVKYATDRIGPFTKTVTLASNATGAPSKVLTIKGTVLADEPVKEEAK